jgi:hypothetical protein
VKVNIEQIIEIIVREVIAELSRLVVEIEFSTNEIKKECSYNCKKENKRAVIDMGNYKTPLLTENRIIELDSSIVEIVIPKDTVLTPGANEVIRKRNLIIINN